MKITCHIDYVRDYPTPLSHLQVTLYPSKEESENLYEAKSTCFHVKEIGQAFAAAYYELLRQVGEDNLR